MKESLIKIYWKLRIKWLAIQWIFQVNLGDYVYYKGKKYIVFNGVRSESWRLSGLENGDSGWVPRSECKKVLSWSNINQSYKSGVSFYMTNWYSIWCRKGIEPWVKGLPIWPRRNK